MQRRPLAKTGECSDLMSMFSSDSQAIFAGVGKSGESITLACLRLHSAAPLPTLPSFGRPRRARRRAIARVVNQWRRRKNERGYGDNNKKEWITRQPFPLCFGAPFVFERGQQWCMASISCCLFVVLRDARGQGPPQ